MLRLSRGLDLPAWVAPYAPRDARLGYLSGHDGALVSEGFPREEAARAARVRWGGRRDHRLEAARLRRLDARWRGDGRVCPSASGCAVSSSPA